MNGEMGGSCQRPQTTVSKLRVFWSKVLGAKGGVNSKVVVPLKRTECQQLPPFITPLWNSLSSSGDHKYGSAAEGANASRAQVLTTFTENVTACVV